MKYLDKAAKKGFPDAILLYIQELEKTYIEGNKDYFYTIVYYYRLYIYNMHYENVELLYRYALFVEKDSNYKLIALKYYQIAAHHGHIKAMANYARILYEINPKNLGGVMLYYKRAADGGDIESMYKYGSLLIKNGDVKIAAEYLKKASTNILDAEKLFLELVVEEKYKVENKVEFVKYAKRAAELHIIVGMYKYGLMLIKGDNVAKNYNEGIKYIKEAAELGNIDAMSQYTCDILSSKGISKYDFDHFYEESKKYEKILNDYKSDNNNIFVDENFPHFSNWKRIDEIYDVPLFQEDLISPNFTIQGKIGDCYFISFLSRVAKQPYLVSKLFETSLPNKILGKVKNSINIKCGAVVIYFQAFCVQTPVLIDTYIPVNENTPIFSRPSDKSKSPWFCLVEKAFAKLNGSFSNIVSGWESFSIYSMFFYYSKKIDLSTLKCSNSDMFNKVMKYQKKGYLISASIPEKCNIENAKLIKLHSYFLFRADEIKDEKFICLRNPWGHCEFNGKYSKNSFFWTDELKEKLNFNQCQEGSFFMTDEEFFTYFNYLDILKPIHPTWKIKSFHCQFAPGSNDGILINDRIEFFEKTSKFVFQISDEIPPNEKCRLHIIMEKRKSTFQDQINEDRNIKYCLYIGHVKCQNYEKIRDNINNISYKSISSFNDNDSFSYEIDDDNKNDIIILFLQTLSKRSFIEDCYVSVFCKYNFKLFDFNNPGNDFKNIPNPGISFHNYTLSHPTIANPLLIRFLDDKFVFDFGTLSNGERITKEDFSTFFKYANQKVGSSHIDLNDFEFTKELIGNGTNGKVYIVKEKKTNKQYAAKIYNYRITRTKGFFRELTVFRSVKYPSLVNFRGFSEKDFDGNEFPVLITEYLKKGSLYDNLLKLNDPSYKSKIKEEWTPTKQMISIIGIALGMDYLHHRNIIHRDLKLHNILLDDNLYPKICDFGDSKILEIEQSSNKTFLVGTPLFMAPEISNKNNSYSYPVDVYSFGVICYFIYNQQVPFDQTNPIDFSSPKNKFTNFITLLTDKDPNQRPTFSKIIEMLLSDREGTWIDDSNEKEIELYINKFGLSMKPKVQQINIDTLLFIHEEKYPIDARKPKRTVEQMINDYNFPDSIKNDLIFAEEYIHSKAPINKEIVDKGQFFYYLGTVFCGENKITADIVEKDLYYAIRYLVIALRFKIYRSSYLLSCIFANDTKPESQEIAYIAAKIANFGCNEAFSLLGYFFYRGIGIPFNIVMAAVYFKIAADEGDVDSMVNYAKILLNVGNHELKLKDLKQQIKEAEIIIQKMGNIKDCIFNKTRLTIEALEDEDVALYVSRKYFEKASSQGNKEATEKLLLINQNNEKFDDHPQYFDDFTQ